jgi:predicted molibdopterin-dependent oxidoreductase YjgC
MKSQTIKLKIDSIDVEVERGKMILEAAEAAGVKIPTLCHDRRLVPFGACRLCVVQQKGRKDLQLACFTPVRDGMEIITQSPAITESRKLQLQLILLNHPMICPRCEKEGDCSLQHLVYEYGVEETQYPWEKIPFPVDDISPLLQRDPNRCILCGRCVRICDEVQGIGELSFTERGMKSSIDTDFHRPLDCEFCGQCLDTCPVAAITSDSFDYSTKAWELKETTTPCPYCGCGCLLTIGSKEGEVKRIFSDPSAGPGDGNLCVKGRFGWDFIDHPDRIKTPLLRINGKLQETSWEEALRYVVAEIEKVKAQSSPDSIASILSSRLTNEEYYLIEQLFKGAVGSDQMALGVNGAHQGLTEGLSRTLGIPASTNSIQDLRKADCILLIGVDPAETHPIIKNEIHLAIRKNRAQIILVGSHDIGLTRNTRFSPLSPPAISLLEKPGMEVALVNGMIRTILREDLDDKDFIEKRTEGIEALREKAASPESEAIGTLPETGKKDLERAARAFAQAENGMILIGSGEWSPLPQKEIAIAASNLALITGHLGKASSGILVLLEKSNSQGAIDQGIGSNGGKDVLKKVEEGKIKALYVIGEDPLVKTPRPDRPKRSLEKLQLLVVQDLFMTETARMAHVVLPAASFAEKEGTYTNLERRVQKLNPFRSPIHGAKTDFDIFLLLLDMLESPVPGETAETIFGEISRRNPYYHGIRDGEQWPKGSSTLYSDGFPNGKAKLIPVEDPKQSFISGGTGDYPLLMVQKPSLFRSGLLSRKSENLEMVLGEPSVEINPKDADRLSLIDGEEVRISTPAGSSVKMKVKLSNRPVQGVITALWPCNLIEEGGVATVRLEKTK